MNNCNVIYTYVCSFSSVHHLKQSTDGFLPWREQKTFPSNSPFSLWHDLNGWHIFIKNNFLIFFFFVAFPSSFMLAKTKNVKQAKREEQDKQQLVVCRSSERSAKCWVKWMLWERHKHTKFVWPRVVNCSAKKATFHSKCDIQIYLTQCGLVLRRVDKWTT